MGIFKFYDCFFQDLDIVVWWIGKQLIDDLADMLVSAIDMSQGCDLKQQLIAVETQLIQKALDATSGNVSKAADLLSVRRTTLIEKIKKYQLQEVS